MPASASFGLCHPRMCLQFSLPPAPPYLSLRCFVQVCDAHSWCYLGKALAVMLRLPCAVVAVSQRAGQWGKQAPADLPVWQPHGKDRTGTPTIALELGQQRTQVGGTCLMHILNIMYNPLPLP